MVHSKASTALHLLLVVAILSRYSSAFQPSTFTTTRRTVAAFQQPIRHDTKRYSATVDSRRSKRCVQASTITSPFRYQSSLYATKSPDSDTFDKVCDVLVLGSGPAARSVASLLSAQSSSNGDNIPAASVILADQNLDKPWPPNYGVWQDEWQAILDRYSTDGVTISGGNNGNAIDYEWDKTDCYFGGSFDVSMTQRLRLDRPYKRIDRDALRESLTTSSSDKKERYALLRANHFSTSLAPNVHSPAGSIQHDETGSTVQLKDTQGNIVTVRTKLIIDCTGHETKLVMRESRAKSDPPGFQIAYGCLVDIDESKVSDKTHIGPYDKTAMALFDYRTDHFVSGSAAEKKAELAPTFMYAMPLGGNKVFFEETSLVARPAVSFQECKDRCFTRLEYLGINVTKIHEEEFCYIPMGGALPAKDQRIVPVGGAAAMVHPSTGYHLCRCLMGASDVARVVKSGLHAGTDLDKLASQAYDALWSPDNIRQRNFAVFGGEFLMKQSVVGLRGFFTGFFRLPLELWAGFLAGWPGLPNNDRHETWYARIWYGLNFIVRLPPQIAFDMFISIVSYSVSEGGLALPQSVTPFFGQPDSYISEKNLDRLGDVAVKAEAKRMLSESDTAEFIPVDFTNDSNTSLTSSTMLQKKTKDEKETVDSFQ